MNSRNSERGSPGSKAYWLKSTRTFIARALLRLANSGAAWAERTALRIAPWIDEDE